MLASILGIGLLGLVGVITGEQIELRGGKKFCFYDNLNKGDSWGVQFQIVDNDIALRVGLPIDEKMLKRWLRHR